jgi:hypothetical protein
MFAETHIESGLDSHLSQVHHVIGHLVQSPKLLHCHCQIHVCVCVSLSLSLADGARILSCTGVNLIVCKTRKAIRKEFPYVFCN